MEQPTSGRTLVLVLPLLLLGTVAGCAQRPITHTGSTARLASPLQRSPQGVAIDYGCPDLFEGHIFSCPTIPTLSLGLDVDTDAGGGGVELGCTQTHGGICVSPGIEYGRGSESYGVFDTGFGEEDMSLDYSVLQLKAHGRYAFPVNADSSLTVSPLAGPRFYRFAYTDCPFEDECSENLLVLDVGVGVQYKNFGMDAFTGIGGPNFMLRLKYLFGF